MKTRNYTPEMKERAVRMLIEAKDDYPSTWSAIKAIAPKIGCTPETLRSWHKKHIDKTIPVLPNGQASWDDKNKTLKYFNVVYEVGDIIESGGYKLRPSDRERYAKEGFANQASSRCDVKEMMMLSGLPRGQAARKTL